MRAAGSRDGWMPRPKCALGSTPCCYGTRCALRAAVAPVMVCAQLGVCVTVRERVTVPAGVVSTNVDRSCSTAVARFLVFGFCRFVFQRAAPLLTFVTRPVLSSEQLRGCTTKEPNIKVKVKDATAGAFVPIVLVLHSLCITQPANGITAQRHYRSPVRPFLPYR